MFIKDIDINFSSNAPAVFEGMKVTEHFFELPLDYAQPSDRKITIFAREVVAMENIGNESLHWMIFFQGGPGFPSPRPITKSGWLGEALKTHRVLLLDQRGTGLSSRVLPQTLEQEGDPEQQAEYLTHFRADNIVRDAETIRKKLCGKHTKWLGMGQSYGGFCLLTYLSFAPEGLSGAIITGGVACVKRRIEDNYRLTYQKVREKNEAFYKRYPADQHRALEVLAHLKEKKVEMPTGGILTPRRFQHLGMLLGMSGGAERLHYLLESAFVGGGDCRQLADDFLLEVETLLGFESNPFFAVLHESIYAEGYATQWAAERLREANPDFTIEDPDRLLFTGEMVVPSMFDDYKVLRPLKTCAHLIAEKSDWPKLYDLDQLAKNEVPIAAISYYEDMYVPIEWSRETAQFIPNFYQWVTNEWEHNGIGIDGSRIFKTLLEKLPVVS